MAQARIAFKDSRWVRELEQAQKPDGTWGRFHSRNSALNQRFPTTELALYRARALGMNKADPVILQAIRMMEEILQGRADWSDPEEKHEGWPINKRFITAATLALFDPANPLILPLAQRWREVVRRIFQNGAYDPQAERAAHLEINGVRTKGKYLKLAALYPLILLSVPAVSLEPDLEAALMKWVWQKPDGIYYVYGNSMSQPRL
jgi:hypothetical protein